MSEYECSVLLRGGQRGCVLFALASASAASAHEQDGARNVRAAPPPGAAAGANGPGASSAAPLFPCGSLSPAG
jgi:hypothetical protein